MHYNGGNVLERKEDVPNARKREKKDPPICTLHPSSSVYIWMYMWMAICKILVVAVPAVQQTSCSHLTLVSIRLQKIVFESTSATGTPSKS